MTGLSTLFPASAKSNIALCFDVDWTRDNVNKTPNDFVCIMFAVGVLHCSLPAPSGSAAASVMSVAGSLILALRHFSYDINCSVCGRAVGHMTGACMGVW